MSNLRELIQLCVDAKHGDKQFALWIDGDWCRADIGGSSVVMLGEASGEFRGEGSTPEEAVAALLANIRGGKRN